MSTTATSSTTNSIPTALLTGSTAKADSTTEASDRFLKLLVTQMQNQDPLNPVDNAQVTSQMAQISTVTGIDKLNTTMAGMNTGFTQMQLMQGVSMVGHQVVTQGNQLNTLDGGKATGGFEISSAATSVNVQIKNAAGTVVDTLEMGSASAGTHNFSWTPPSSNASSSYTFNVVAKSGSTTLSPTHLSHDTVDAVHTKDGSLNLQLRNNGDVAYSQIKALS
jgi:flagellar basal-body rod modification protein FlgD